MLIVDVPFTNILIVDVPLINSNSNSDSVGTYFCTGRHDTATACEFRSTVELQLEAGSASGSMLASERCKYHEAPLCLDIRDSVHETFTGGILHWYTAIV